MKMKERAEQDFINLILKQMKMRRKNWKEGETQFS